jgi:ribosomal protein L29
MTSSTSINDLRKLSVADLQQEIRTQRSLVAKMRMGVTMRTEKDTAKYKRERVHLARLLTVLSSKQGPLPERTSDATIPAPSATPKKRSTRKATSARS